MSFRENRDRIVAENVPKLIKSLMGINTSDPNFKTCIDFAFSNIYNCKYATVNSHEIRRKIDGLAERFEISNFKPYGDRLKQLCTTFCNHPTCKDHCETDIEWKVLSFLLNTSRSPIDGVIANKHKIQLNDVKENDKSPVVDEIVARKSDFVEQEFSDSDLSVWSDDDEEKSQIDDRVPNNIIIAKEEGQNLNSLFPGIQPPQKATHFTLLTANSPSLASNLFAKLQHHWWNDPNYVYPSVTDFKTANYGHFWNSRTSNVKLSTISEYCLIREILLMFVAPTNCKFFHIDNENIEVNDLVSLNSVSLPVIQSYLQEFCRPIDLVQRLRTFYVSIRQSNTPSYTYQCFAQGIQQCLRSFDDFILAKERQVNELEQLVHPITIVNLLDDMREHFKFILSLHNIYENVTLDLNKYPAHICATYLVCSLFKEIKSSIDTMQSHLATSLFLTSIETYFRITHVWWTNGLLEDWRDEYFIERSVTGEDQIDIYKLRTYHELDSHQLSVISNCSFLKILQKCAIDASSTLSTLYRLDRIRDVRKQIGNQENLYQIFLKLVFDELPTEPTSTTELETSTVELHPQKIATYSPTKIEKFRTEFAGNPFLFLFEEQLRQIKDGGRDLHDINTEEFYGKSLHNRLKQNTTFIRPYHHYFTSILTKLLNDRISVADKLVLQIYKDEYQVVHHLRILPKVYFLEAGDLMSDFYSKLFTQIENSDSWNNPYILTTQLNGILSYRISNSSFLFRVHVKSKRPVRDVIRAIDEISLSYVGNDNLHNIITDECIENYNKVFRFLLKMKWGIWSLENLRFPRQMKGHMLYGEVNVSTLTFKRLALLRNWIMYSLQSLLSHFMTTVLHFMSYQLNSKVENAKNLMEIVSIHSTYIKKITDRCFQNKRNEKLCEGITQLLSLIIVLRDEWRNMESSTDEFDGGFIIDEIYSLERTYVNCHAYLADVLLSEVYTNNKSEMAGLSAAFNCSRPY